MKISSAGLMQRIKERLDHASNRQLHDSRRRRTYRSLTLRALRALRREQTKWTLGEWGYELYGICMVNGILYGIFMINYS